LNYSLEGKSGHPRLAEPNNVLQQTGHAMKVERASTFLPA
jgi:hypothetical protein